MRYGGLKVIHWIQIGVILFVGLNVLLVYKDTGDNVDRIAYINEWGTSETADMKEELLKEAVLVPDSETPIFFTENQGVFQEFLVEEGEEITVGQELFTYQVQNYYEAEAELLSEIERIDGAITATEQAILEVQSINFTENQLYVPPIIEEEFSITVEVPTSSMEAEFMKRQFLAEKQKEVSQLRAEQQAITSQLQSLQSTGDMITYTSPYAGRVSNVSKELASPILTIESLDLHIEADLTEHERAIVEEGMKAEMQINAIAEILPASVADVADAPNNLRMESGSKYSLIATLGELVEEEVDVDELEEVEDEFEEDDASEEVEEVEEGEIPTLFPGYHGILAILLEERIGVTAVDDHLLIDGAVWKMTTDGLLVKEKVERGFEEFGQVEVIGDIVAGDLLAEAPESQLRDLAFFITPLKWSELGSATIKAESVDWRQGIIGGLISR